MPIGESECYRSQRRKDGCSLAAKRKDFEKEALSLPPHEGRVNVNVWVWVRARARGWRRW